MIFHRTNPVSIPGRLRPFAILHHRILEQCQLIIRKFQFPICFFRDHLIRSVCDRRYLVVLVYLPFTLPFALHDFISRNLLLRHHILDSHEPLVHRIMYRRLHQEIPERLFQPKSILPKLPVPFMIGRGIDG